MIFRIEVHHYHHYADERVLKMLGAIMVKEAETAQEIRSLRDQVLKGNEEIKGKIAALEEAINNQDETSQEVTDALAELKSAVQAQDDIVPDAPTPQE